MGAVQFVIQGFVEGDPASCNPVFLIAAYDQELETPNIKVFLPRATSREQRRQRRGS